MKGKKVHVIVETLGGNIHDVCVYENGIDSDTAVIKWRNENGITSDEEAEGMDDNDGTAMKEYEVEIE